MRLRFVLNDEILSFLSGKLPGAGLLCVEMIKTRLPGEDFAVFCDF